ncbi:GNAT family N-acetyltransferase [Parvularcula lutaonensis]|uniref:GNAT family N-acetyltransferase n=1 Tax=Parvularcula lutaonensis TaxID=491923 RepID=A0ABV7MAS1_9PROT|nr:GNAT family N-acetyltransferase [Parvularcula lutaonensis]GGY46339.1 hypothetical protein GCM10007148_14310 [Parvularcula lutaonensis]
MVKLRPIDPSRDAEPLHAVLGDEEACRYLPDPPGASVADTREKLARWAGMAPKTDWAITEDDGDTAIGRITIYEKDGGVWEVGIMTCPEAQGRGIGGEALRLAMDEVDRLYRPRRIEADIDPDNTPSLRLFERHGFTSEGVLRKRWETHIGQRDTVMLAIIDTDPRPWRDDSAGR